MAGAVGAVVVGGFSWMVMRLWEFGGQLGWPLRLLLPVAAGLVVGLLIYRFLPMAGGASLPHYVLGVRECNGYVSERVVVGKFFAATINLGCGISGGSFGPVMLTSAGICGWIATRGRRLLDKLGFHNHDFEQFTICGAAAAAGALSGAPIAGGIIAAEILFPANVRYRHLMPALLASVVGHACHSTFMGKIGVYNLTWAVNKAVGGRAGAFTLDWQLFAAIAAVLVVAVLLGGGFAAFYRATQRLCLKMGRWRMFAPAVGAAGAALIALAIGLLIHQEWGVLTLGLGRNAVLDVTQLNDAFWWALLLLVIGKSLATGLAVGSGNASGLVLPMLLIGALLGKLIATLMGITAGPQVVLLVATGSAAMLAVTINVPLAAAVLAVELFGIHVGPTVAAVAVLAFLIGRPVALLDYLDKRERGVDDVLE